MVKSNKKEETAESSRVNFVPKRGSDVMVPSDHNISINDVSIDDDDISID